MRIGDKVYIHELKLYGEVKGIVDDRATMVSIQTPSGGTKLINVINYTVIVVNFIDQILPVIGHIFKTIKSWFK